MVRPLMVDRNRHQVPAAVTRRYYRVDRREIAFLRFVLEGCEGVAGMTTIDPLNGSVVFLISPGCEAEFDRILDDLKPEILMEHDSSPAQ
ncbi:MAG: DUF4911 domain-containing protein [Desulfosudaceae bacterium]